MRAAPALLALLLATPAGAVAEGVDGIWRTERQPDGAYIQIEIGPCESAPTERCGVIEGAYAGARQDIVGDQIIRGMERVDRRRWDHGEIIRPGRGSVYSSRMTLDPGGEVLKVEGCAIAGLFCGGQMWVRVSGPAHGGENAVERGTAAEGTAPARQGTAEASP